jgi:hypothetical protein
MSCFDSLSLERGSLSRLVHRFGMSCFEGLEESFNSW